MFSELTPRHVSTLSPEILPVRELQSMCEITSAEVANALRSAELLLGDIIWHDKNKAELQKEFLFFFLVFANSETANRLIKENFESQDPVSQRHFRSQQLVLAR